MRTLTDHEKRTLRLGAVGVAIYLVLFFGWRGWRHLELGRSEYQQLWADAQKLQRELRPYENKLLLTQKLRETYRLDPWKLSRATVVAEASAAIQNEAKSRGLELGPIREAPARASAKELASMQFEGIGPVPAVITLLHRLEILGYPMILDSLQINADPTKPGMVKVNFTMVILDFDQWKTPEPPHA
jgi:hypothetical protein